MLLLKHKIELEWNASEYVPYQNEIILYDVEIDEDGKVLLDENGNKKLPEGRNLPYEHTRLKIGNGIDNVSDLPFIGGIQAINSVESLPEVGAEETSFYTFTEKVGKPYAISSARKNIVNKIIDGTEYDLVVELKEVDSLPTSNIIDVVDSITSPTTITIYYLKTAIDQPGEARVYVSSGLYTLLWAASLAGKVDISNIDKGWNDPVAFIPNYSGVIADARDAEYGNVYIIDNIKFVRHTLQYADGEWYELALNAQNDLTPRLGQVSKEKFETTSEELINVNAYRNLNNNFDRVYVEQAGNSCVSGDYCLTPSIETLPEHPWVTPKTGELVRIQSIPVRKPDGSIEVYIDGESADASAVSKKYFEDNLIEYVHRKPEESTEVSNAGLSAAHTWAPNDGGYNKRTEKFDTSENIPSNVVYISNVGTKNTISIDTTNQYLKCVKESGSSGLTMYLTRQDLYSPAALTFDIYINPTEKCLQNRCRGLSLTPYNSAQGGNPIWSTLCNFSIISPSAGNYVIKVGQEEIFDFTPHIGKWVNFRMEFDALTKGAERRIYINNKLINKNSIGAALTGMKSFQVQALPSNSAEGDTLVGEIGFDNIYFGEIPPEVKYNGYDTLTAIAYDYEDPAVESLNRETIVSRKPDGSVLVKKELSDADDDRSATSKYYVEAALAEIGSKTIDNIYVIDTWAASSSHAWVEENGIAWIDEFAFLDHNDTPNQQGQITQKIPIVAGNNVNFEVDGDVVKINATGGASGTENSMYSEGLVYTLSDDGTYYICTGIGTCDDFELRIPHIYNGLPVKEIGSHAFCGGYGESEGSCGEPLNAVLHSEKNIHTFVTKVIIPDGITRIGDMAFSTRSDSLDPSISPSTITNIVLPDSITEIGHGAFRGCYLTDIHIPPLVTEILEQTFETVDGNQNIIIPKNITNIAPTNFSPNCTFYCEAESQPEGWSGWIASDFGGDVEQKFIWNFANDFIAANNKINSLAEQSYSKGLEYTLSEDGAYYICTGPSSTFTDTKLVIASYHNGLPVKEIAEQAFCRGCYVNEGDSDSAHADHSGGIFDIVTEIIIPETVTKVGKRAFCAMVSFDSGEPYWSSTIRKIRILNDDCELEVGAFYGCQVTDIVLPKNLKIINDELLRECPLTQLDIPSTVTHIGRSSLSSNRLTEIQLPDELLTIGEYAFSYSNCLQTVILSNQVQSIGDSAFYDCPSLSNVYYTGSLDNWENINVDQNNDEFLSAVIHYGYANNFVDVDAKISAINTSGATGVPPFELSQEGEFLRIVNGEVKWSKVLRAEGNRF